MKFTSRKDVFFKLVILIITSVLLVLAFLEIYFVGVHTLVSIFVAMLILSVAGFLLWSFFDTYYELTQTELLYRSGPIHGRIKIKDIKEITKGKTLWSGLRPATARNGLIIKYLNYEEIYISPNTNDSFITKVLELNKSVKVN